VISDIRANPDQTPDVSSSAQASGVDRGSSCDEGVIGLGGREYHWMKNERVLDFYAVTLHTPPN